MKPFINPSISPNVELEDLLASIKQIFLPLGVKNGEYIARVEAWFKYNYNASYAFTFSSAREGAYAILLASGIKSEDEVLVQAFTCIAAVDPILWLGAKPIYVDIDENTLSMDLLDAKNKITKKTKAIILQHTFGIAGNIDEAKKFAKSHKLLFIEDCAHTIGSEVNGRKLGTSSDAAFFSFGRDKSVSSVFGGVVITNDNDLALEIKRIRDLSPFPSYIWIYQQLFHPFLTFLVIKGFEIHEVLGKILLYVLKNLHIISRPILNNDIHSYLGKRKIKRYPNALAQLALIQLVKIQKFNKRRRDIYNQYKDALGSIKQLSYPEVEYDYLRIPITPSNKADLKLACREKGIYLGDWYEHVIDPSYTDYTKIGYEKNSCKVAERIAKRILNLPCYPTMSDNDIQKVIIAVKAFYGKK